MAIINIAIICSNPGYFISDREQRTNDRLLWEVFADGIKEYLCQPEYSSDFLEAQDWLLSDYKPKRQNSFVSMCKLFMFDPASLRKVLKLYRNPIPPLPPASQ
jgi:hypothetical protein